MSTKKSVFPAASRPARELTATARGAAAGSEPRCAGRPCGAVGRRPFCAARGGHTAGSPSTAPLLGRQLCALRSRGSYSSLLVAHRPLRSTPGDSAEVPAVRSAARRVSRAAMALGGLGVLPVTSGWRRQFDGRVVLFCAEMTPGVCE